MKYSPSLVPWSRSACRLNSEQEVLVVTLWRYELWYRSDIRWNFDWIRYCLSNLTHSKYDDTILIILLACDFAPWMQVLWHGNKYYNECENLAIYWGQSQNIWCRVMGENCGKDFSSRVQVPWNETMLEDVVLADDDDYVSWAKSMREPAYHLVRTSIPWHRNFLNDLTRSTRTMGILRSC